jgi:hypothetical protein
MMYQSTDKSEIAGLIHNDTRSMPGCVQTVVESKQGFHIGGGMIDLPAKQDFLKPYGYPDNPNHLEGDKTTEGPGHRKTVVKWDLIRDVE